LVVAIPFGLAVCSLLIYALWIAAGQDTLSESHAAWFNDGTMLLAGIACLCRAAVSPRLRTTWVAFGLGLIAWGSGDVYWQQVLVKRDAIPYPSAADLGYLLALPCFFVGTGHLIKHRVGRFSVASWFDGAIGALGAAALATALFEPALIGLTDGRPAAVFTNLAYPLGDLLLIAFLTGALVISGVRRARVMILVGAGLVSFCAADVTYLYQEATGGYDGGWNDIFWILGGVLIAAGAVQAPSLEAKQSGAYRSSRMWPAAFTLLAAALLVWDHFAPIYGISVWLAAATIVAVVIRLTLSFRDNDRLMEELHGDAVTDALTGLANRRQLVDDLECVFASNDGADGGEGGYVFALFDLDGFKAYNDTFGHPAGDALLRRLGDNLATALDGAGTAYRLGGDEFCILAPLRGRKPASTFEMARAALAEQGDGFSIAASGGPVRLPDEAEDAAAALRLADQRMYKEKNAQSMRSADQTQAVLMRIFREREPALTNHIEGVARLAREVGKALALDAEELDVLCRAAELHDIGKIAIPDDVLQKRGPLDEIEWGLMRRHTLVGARILDSAPAMKDVARLIRSSHERWDGQGYPDGLIEEEIPLGSRIIFICDSYDAMTTDRPYKAAITHTEALAELRRHGGSQFDPGLVETACAAIEAARRVEHVPA
jgi:two-component system cell cycle response regulator